MTTSTASIPSRSLRQQLRTNTEQPTVAISGNLCYTRGGTWWANYLVEGMNYGLRDVDAKDKVRVDHQNLFQEVPDYSLLGGFSVPMDIGACMRRMVSPSDLDRPDYIDECNAQAARLEALAPRTRLYWLSMPLDQKFRTGAAGSRLLNMDFISGAVTPPTEEEVDAAATAANKLAKRLDSIVTMTPVTGRQVRWLWDHHISRGLDDAGPCPPIKEGTIRPGVRSFTQALFDEGANADRIEHTGWWKRNTPSFDRIVKISRPYDDDPRTTYQSMLTVKSFPMEEMIFPGGTEFLQIADALTGRGDRAVIDWVLRIRRVGRAEVLAENLKKLKQIDEQLDQRDGETSFGAGMLYDKARTLADYNAIIEGSDDECEIRFTPIFAVGAKTRDAAATAVNALETACKGLHISLETPLGAQKELWMSMVPGAHHIRAVDACVHITPSADAAAFVPFVSADVGDGTGPVIGINLSSGTFEPVHLDIVGRCSRQMAASVAVVGEPGGGKTYCIQTIGSGVLDKGGQILAVDRTELGEYANWAKGLTKADVIDIADPSISMDTLRVFQPDEAAARTLDLLLPLINVSATSPVASVLQRMLHPESRHENDIYSLADLTHFLTSPDLPEMYRTSDIDRLANLLSFWTNDPNASVLFNPNLPPMRLDAPATIVRTHRLELPKPEEMHSEHLFERMKPTKHMGSALYGLIATIARRAFFARQDRLGVFILDEAHHLTTTYGGSQVVTEFARDGRKHNAACVMGSQDPDDFGDLTDFFTTLLVFKQTKLNQARKSLRWLGLDPDKNEQLVKDLMYHTSPAGKKGERPAPERRGECYIRDVQNNIARMKTLGPALERRAAVMDTNAPAVA
ncbi:ATP-binding protein [Mycolicibacterium mucogenicum]|uniref:ATP-binding protein n=1 Tax=Mycolicibacterium mucogenicum TaxID=56689 RepID=UPI0009EAEB30|nr:ATP-binding protein [Mycolicibacterium mucogenicum]MCX8559170.1 ATP-binding protein [Mycolicibacterium mucogenicum]